MKNFLHNNRDDNERIKLKIKNFKAKNVILGILKDEKKE
jgi:hypothetical protein